MSCTRYVSMAIVLWLVAVAAATPVRRSQDLEARRRSAIDRSLVRFGRSYPSQISAADIREALQRPTRRGNSFLRLGRSQSINVPAEDLMALLRAYEEDYDTAPAKRAANFIRFGRDPNFVRFGRSNEENTNGLEQNSELFVSGTPQRIGRARNHFLRLGRDSEEVNDDNDFDEELANERRKRSADDACQDCSS